MNELTDHKYMTVTGIAEVLGVTAEAIRKHVRELFPNVISNGITTYLNEEQITEIKKRMIPTTRVEGAVTRIDKAEVIAKAIRYIKEELEDAKAEVETLRIQLDESIDWYSVKRIQSMGHFPGADPRNLWRPVKAWSIENHYETNRIPDPNYEHGVLCYHKDAWEGAYGIKLG